MMMINVVGLRGLQKIKKDATAWVFAWLFGFAALASVLVPNTSTGVSITFSGTLRGDGDFFENEDLGFQGGKSKEYLSSRMLLSPSILIDDHLAIQSEWNLLTSPLFAPSSVVNANNPNPYGQVAYGQGGYLFGDYQAQGFVLARAYLEWTSDFGVLRLGRMPFSWGYGLVYDSGDGIWDNYQTTFDRLEYRLHLGQIVGGLAYSKPMTASFTGGGNDGAYYTGFVLYNSSDSELNAGILYEKQARSGANQGPALLNMNPTEIGLGTGVTPVPYPVNANLADIFLRKKAGVFRYGIEGSWLNGSATAYPPSTSDVNLDAVALTGNLELNFESWNIFLEGLFASGDSNLAGGHLNDFGPAQSGAEDACSPAEATTSGVMVMRQFQREKNLHIQLALLSA